MNSHSRDIISQALQIAPEAVERLHEDATLLPVLLAELLLASRRLGNVEAHRVVADRDPGRLGAAAQRWCTEFRRVFGERPQRAADILKFADRGSTPDARVLRAASEALVWIVRSAEGLDARGLGMALAQIARRRDLGPLQVIRHGKVDGAQAWAVRERLGGD